MRAGTYVLWNTRMRNPTTRRPVNLRQLCAIARLMLEPEPEMDDSEWKARTKLALAKQGYAEPSPALLESAMWRVEQAVSRENGPRPVRTSPPPTMRPESRPLTAAEARAALQQVLTSCAPPSLTCAPNSAPAGCRGWSGLGAGGSTREAPRSNTLAQIAEWRRTQTRPAKSQPEVDGEAVRD